MREETTLIERTTLEEQTQRSDNPFSIDPPAPASLAPVGTNAPQTDATLDNSIEVLKEMAFNLLQEVKALSHSPATDFTRGVDFYDEVRRFEIDLIHRALAITDGHQSRAARLLNLKITTLNSMMKRYNIIPTPPAAAASSSPAPGASCDASLNAGAEIEELSALGGERESVSLAATGAEPTHINAGLRHHRAA